MLKFSSKSTVTQKDRGQKNILAQIALVGRQTTISTGIHPREGLRIPTFEGKKIHKSTHISQYAFFMEYGTRKKDGRWHSKPRPFMRISFNASKDVMESMALMGLKRVYGNRGTLKGTFELMGRYQREYIKGTIRLLNYPPNKEYTRNKKDALGRLQTPLIFTGAMHNAVTYRVNRSKRVNKVKQTIEAIDKLIVKASSW